MTETTSRQPGRRFLLRVAGLPIETVRDLRCPDTARWADAVVAAERDLLDRGQELSDLLHTLVPALDRTASEDAAPQRRRLLALRRDVFNNRLPARPADAVELIAQLDPTAAERTGQWLEDRRALDELRSRGTGLLSGELDRSRTALAALLTEERLRKGLLLASPTLETQLERYLRLKAGAQPDKRLRKIERSVLSYVYRTACKTSPFSTLTGVALGRAEDGHGPVMKVSAAWRSRVRLNVVVLARLTELILASPDLRADLPVRLASGWGSDDQRIRYVRRWVTTGDDDAAVTFDAVQDRLFYLRRSGILDDLIALLGGRTPDMRHGRLVEWLSTAYDAGPELCETYVSALLELGMLRVPCLETDVHTADPLRAYQDALRALERPWADALAGELGTAVALLDEYPRADAAGRAKLLRRLRACLSAAQQLVGAEEVSLPQTLLYEDTDAGGDIRCGPGNWAGPGGALDAVERILPAFDLTLPQRVTFQGFFTARYGRGGRCDDLLGLVHDFHEDFFDQYLSFTSRRVPYTPEGDYVPEENWLGLERIRKLDTARRTFTGHMRDLWADHTGEDDLVLEEPHLADVADALSGVDAGAFAPRCHHLQLAAEQDEPLVVLNRSYGGLSFPFSRFTHLWDDLDGGADSGHVAEGPLSGRLREEAVRRTPPGAVLAEITGGAVTSNLNLHGRLTEYQIVCPGEASSVPEDRRIHLEDLYLVHDAAEDRLRLHSTRLGREVVPVYLGYLVPLALPEIPRTLLLLSPTSMAPLDVWAGVPRGPEHEGVTRRPRVRHGNVVLSRRSWSLTAAALPPVGESATRAEVFLAWRRWRLTHGLPARVFATVSGGARSGAGAKPQYVDFDSPLSLTAFQALVTAPEDRIELRETLPSENGLHVFSERGSHVAELSVETFTTRAPDPAPARRP